MPSTETHTNYNRRTDDLTKWHSSQYIECVTQDQKVWCSVLSVGYVYKCRAYIVFHTDSVHLAIIGTWCTDSRLDQLLQAAVRPLPWEVQSEEHV